MERWKSRLTSMPVRDALRVLDDSGKAAEKKETKHARERLEPLREAVKAAHPATYLFETETDHTVTVASLMASQPQDVRDHISETYARIRNSTPTDAPVSEGGFKKPDGTYTAEREALHRKIIETLLSPDAIAAARPAPGESPTFTILGGRGGSGKSWFTQNGVVANKPIVFDNDKIKSMLPEYQGWNAALVHEEASHIFNVADNIARSLGLNVVHDATMKTAKNSEAFAAAYKKAGYRVEGFYMFLPPDIAAERAIKRFRGPTGRFVPPDYVMASRDNDKTFDNIRHIFSRWAVYDNNVPRGEAPRLVANSDD